MSLDTKYRPRRYEDVLGQEATIVILREYVRSGRGFRQSYLFAGGFGSGKTTLGRILARALLCDSSENGDPCDKCSSCTDLLANGASADFVEIDAATNSGKDDMLRITEEILYQSFSGKRRLYLFDESHQLSPGSLDAILKPMEEDVSGTEDKKLVCIFCTTEPERMRATVLSRCAPAFVVRPQPPSVIAGRMAFVCDHENIPYEPEALALIAEIVECHVRDALKAIEGISMMGTVSVENTRKYLHLDLNTAYLDVLDAVGTDLVKAMDTAREIMQQVSPRLCYERLADAAMLAFRAYLGESIPAYWNAERLKLLGKKGVTLLGYASRFASRPGKPTSAMLLCDVASLHHGGGSVVNSVPEIVVRSEPMATREPPVSSVVTRPEPVPQFVVSPVTVVQSPSPVAVEKIPPEWVVHPKGTNRRGSAVRRPSADEMPVEVFVQMLYWAIHNGSTR